MAVGFKDKATAQKLKALAGSAVRRSAGSGLLLPDSQAALHRAESCILAYTLEDVPAARLRTEEDEVERFRGKFVVCSSLCNVYALVRIADGEDETLLLPPQGRWTDDLQDSLDQDEAEFDEEFLRVVPLMRIGASGQRVNIRQRVWNFWPSDVWAKKLVVIDRHRDAGVWYFLGESCSRMEAIPDPEET